MNSYPHWTIYNGHLHCQAPGCRRTHNTPALAEAVPTPRDVIADSDLCSWHTRHFGRVLADLSGVWPVLEQSVYRKTGGGEENQRVQTSGIVDISQSWNPHVTEVMTELAEWTAYLVRTVLHYRLLPESSIVDEDEHGRHVAVHARGLTTRTHTRDALAALALHDAVWLAGTPTLGPSWLADAQDLRMAAVRAIDSDPVRRVGISGAVCGETVVDAGLGPVSCLSTMVAIISADVEGRPSVIVCAEHPKTHRSFTRAEWMDLE
jgi:hypothetical protein